jgi:hypothetical protein
LDFGPLLLNLFPDKFYGITGPEARDGKEIDLLTIFDPLIPLTLFSPLSNDKPPTLKMSCLPGLQNPLSLLPENPVTAPPGPASQMNACAPASLAITSPYLPGSTSKPKNSRKRKQVFTPPAAGPAPQKKMKDSQLSTIAIQVLVTGIVFSPSCLATLKSLGVTICEDPALATHLVAEKVTRTFKFLAAFSVCKYALHHSWITESVKRLSLQPEKDYLLQDKKVNTNEVLKQYQVYRIPGGYEPDATRFSKIVECAGGTVITAKPSGGSTHALVVVSSEMQKIPRKERLSVTKQVGELVAQGLTVYNQEVIFSGVLAQKLDLENNILYQGNGAS